MYDFVQCTFIVNQREPIWSKSRFAYSHWHWPRARIINKRKTIARIRLPNSASWCKKSRFVRLQNESEVFVRWAGCFDCLQMSKRVQVSNRRHSKQTTENERVTMHSVFVAFFVLFLNYRNIAFYLVLQNCLLNMRLVIVYIFQ